MGLARICKMAIAIKKSPNIEEEMQDEIKRPENTEDAMKKIDGDTITEEETGNILMHTILTAPYRLNDMMERLSKSNLNWIEVFKHFDSQHFNIESKEQFIMLFKIWTKISKENTFPFNLLLLDWGNKVAQTNVVNYILDLQIDISANLFLNKMVKKEAIRDNVSYLNAVEIFKCIGQLNSKSHILRIKGECPEMCLLGLASIIPKFSDVFDDLFHKAIEQNSFVLEYLFCNRKVLNKLELLDRDTALRLILEHRLLDVILNQNNEFSFEILVMCVKKKIINASVFLAYKAKQESFVHSLLLFLLKKEVECSFFFVHAVDSISSTFRAETHTNYLKFKGRVESSYLFSDLRATIESFKDIKKLKKMKEGCILQRNFLMKLCNFVIESYEPKFRELLEELFNENIFCRSQRYIAEKLLRFLQTSSENQGSTTGLAFPINKASLYTQGMQGEAEQSRQQKQVQVLSCFTERLKNATVETYEQIFDQKLQPFDDELMLRYILLYRMCNTDSVVSFLEEFPNFETFFVAKVLKKVETHFDCQECVHPRFMTNLGIVIGRLTLKKNRMFSLSLFDTRKFIEDARRSKRYFLLNFAIAVLMEGKSRVFQMNNPWLKRVIQDIVNVHAADVAPLVAGLRRDSDVCGHSTRDSGSEAEISSMMESLSLKTVKDLLIVDLSPLIKQYGFAERAKVIKSTEYLAKYILPNSKYDEVIAMALDLSIREVSKAMVGRTMALVERTVSEVRSLFNVKGMPNLYQNLCLSLLHINAHEPLKVCIKSNMSSFFKMASLDVNKISVGQIIENNLEIAKEVIKRDVYTRVKSTCVQDGEVVVDLHILSRGRQYDQIKIKEVTERDIDEIKKKLRSIGKEIPNTRLSLIANELRSIVSAIEALGHERTMGLGFCNIRNLRLSLARSICNMLGIVKKSECCDEMAESLCKELLGTLFRTNSSFLYLVLCEVFKISFSAYLEVKGFLIYSRDERVTEDFIVDLLRYNVVPSIEYDQFLASDEFQNGQTTGMDILRRVVLGPRKICTIYDFLYTLEHISKSQSIKFVDRMVVDLKQFLNPEQSGAAFDDVVRTHKFSTCPEHFRTKQKCDSSFVFSALLKAWDFFLKFHRVPSSYKFVKADCLVEVVDDPHVFLSALSDVLVYGLDSENVLFMKFLNRVILGFFARFQEFRSEFALCIRPSVVPQLVTTFFCISEGGPACSAEILKALNASPSLLGNALEYFKKESAKFHCVYAYLCSPRFPELKNLFMDGMVTNIDDALLLALPYFKIRRRLFERRSAWDMRSYRGYVNAVVDSLANEYYDEIRIIVRNKYRMRELRNCLEARISCDNVRVCLVTALELVSGIK